MSIMEEVRAQVVALETEITELSELESITPEQDVRLDEAIAEHAERHAELKRFEKRAADIERVKASQTGSKPGAPTFMHHVETPDVGDLRRMLPGELRSAALKVLDDRESIRHLQRSTDRSLEHVEKLIRADAENMQGHVLAQRLLITERSEYRSAFVKKTLGLTTNPDEDRALIAFEEFRAMTEGTGSAGGFGIPVLIDPSIILTAQGTPTDIIGISNVKTITTNLWKGVSSAGVTWSFDPEASEVSDDSPTLAQPSVTVYTARGFIPFSIELGQDYPGFAEEMRTLLESGYRELLANKLINGTGTAEPRGVAVGVSNATSRVLPITDGAFVAGDVYKVWAALPQRYRANASWLSHTTTQNSIRAFDTAGGAQFTVDMTQDAVPQLFGRPYYLNDYMTAFSGSTAVSEYLIVGDFSNYVIAQRAGMTIELVPMLLHTANNLPNGMRGWFAWARVGADVVNTAGFRIVANA